MTEGYKYVAHAIAVALGVLVVVFTVGITIGAAIRADWLWIIIGLIGMPIAGVLLRQTIRNGPM